MASLPLPMTTSPRPPSRSKWALATALIAFLVLAAPPGCSNDNGIDNGEPCPGPTTECESRHDAWTLVAYGSGGASADDAGDASIYGDAGPLDEQGLPLGCPAPSKPQTNAPDENTCCRPVYPVCPL